MSEIFKFEKRYKYPHMKPNDIEIWERFIEKFPEYYNSVQYDFNVGDPPPFNPLADDGTDLNQDKLYRLKIDVVGHYNNIIDIIEIKPNAGPGTVGQVIGYRELYLRDEQPKEKVQAVILTNKIQPNMEYLCKIQDVKLIVV